MKQNIPLGHHCHFISNHRGVFPKHIYADLCLNELFVQYANIYMCIVHVQLEENMNMK